VTYLDYASRDVNSAWRYGLTLVLGPAIAMISGGIVLLILDLAHLVPAGLADKVTHPENTMVFFAANGLIFASLLVGYQLAIRLLHRKRFGDIIGVWRWRKFGTGLGLWLAILIVVTLIDFALAPRGFHLSGRGLDLPILATVIAALAVQTFTEEFVFRGYLTQGLLLAIKRPFAASVISGLVFGALHIPNGWPQAANAVVFGIVLSLIAIRTGGIAFSFGLHLINNLFGAVVVVSANDVFKGTPALITQNTPHLVWWDMALASLALAVVWGLVTRHKSLNALT
jgi:uncharacterized protein